MSGKRKASNDAPGSPRPPPPRRGAGNDDEHSSHSGDSRSDRTYPADDEHSPLRGDHVGGADSDEQESGVAMRATNVLLRLNYRPLSRLPAEWRPSDWEELAAAEAQEHSPPSDDQHAEEEVQPPPPADQSAAAEVADQSVAAAAPAPEMVVPAADSVLCTGCWREPASVRLVPVEHACFCLPCRSSGLSYCVFCDAPSR